MGNARHGLSSPEGTVNRSAIRMKNANLTPSVVSMVVAFRVCQRALRSRTSLKASMKILFKVGSFDSMPMDRRKSDKNNNCGRHLSFMGCHYTKKFVLHSKSDLNLECFVERFARISSLTTKILLKKLQHKGQYTNKICKCDDMPEGMI